MIQVPNNAPKTVSFTQVVNNATASIAKAQVGKLALAETQARGEMESANFHLAKATENLRVAEIAYRESIAKSSWNKETLRSAYNNAIAGYRDADRRAQSATEAFTLAKATLEGTYVSAGLVEKREFSDEKRQDLADKGKALPDGSYPIETKADLANAIQSYGRAKNPDAVKAHIVEQAKKLGATDQLPDNWDVSKSIRKDSTMDMSDQAIANALAQDMSEYPADPAVTCIDCNAEGCDSCDGSGFMPVSVVFGKSVASGGFDFTTDSLLTRDFEKSVAYQDYIFTKGGKGSGAKPGHEFYGNQHTGGRKLMPRLGIRRSDKENVAFYAAGAKAASEAAESHKILAANHLDRGRTAQAAAELRAAAALHMTAAGNHEGRAGSLGKLGDEEGRKAARGEAAKQRVYAQRAKDKANELDGGAGAAVA
jgi:hypothetical protein